MGRSLSVSRKWFDAFDTETAATQELARICIKSLHDARSSQVSIDEDTNVLVQYVPSLTRLVIFGAGDDARPLCTLGAQLGWHVSVADRRARLATAERFPDADAVLAAEWDDAVDRVRFSSRTAVVLMTHSLEDDARVLSLLPSRHIAYLGALGPAHRREWLLAEAATLRGSVQTEIASRLKGPIGFDLGDRSPAGIAVAVTAEILADLNSRSGHPLHQTTPLSTTESRPGMCVVAM
jgi:xanthine/CO dehydrogenase XdhC/CoxF family maturation factor